MTGRNQLILALDTATRCCSVALTSGNLGNGEVLAHISFSSTITHSRRLISIVERIFRETDTEWTHIAGVAVGLGPGSFTGLRIGMATAKGFAAAAEKKLLGVSTLDALAAMCVTDKRICAVLDARKKQVYTAFYSFDDSDCLVRQGEIRAVSPEQLIAEIDEPVIMIGDGVVSYGALWKKELGERVSFAPRHLHSPSAAAIGLMCHNLLDKDRCLDLASATPLYVRASDAELSLVAKRGTQNAT